MTVFRASDAALINRIANIPEIQKTIGAHLAGQTLDFTECAERPDDYLILTNGVDAVGLFEIRRPVTLDGHSMFDFSCRGRDAIRVGREMIDWIFTNTPALIITGATPTLPDFRAARWFNRQIGMKSDGVQYFNGEHWQTEMEYFHILRTDWERQRHS